MKNFSRKYQKIVDKLCVSEYYIADLCVKSRTIKEKNIWQNLRNVLDVNSTIFR